MLKEDRAKLYKNHSALNKEPQPPEEQFHKEMQDFSSPTPISDSGEEARDTEVSVIYNYVSRKLKRQEQLEFRERRG